VLVSGSGIAYSGIGFWLWLGLGIEILLRSRDFFHFLIWHSVCTLSGELANFTALKKARALGWHQDSTEPNVCQMSRNQKVELKPSGTEKNQLKLKCTLQT